MDRWSDADANAWHRAQPWRCGFNFLPSTAVNFLEMWHPDSFDPDTINRELGWAAELGFNAFRINLNYLVWKHDRDGLLDRFDRVVQTASDRGIVTIPVLFDDCGFGGFETTYGPQPAPVPGVHNSRAVASPGRAMLLSGNEWPGFEAYVRDIIRSFRNDARILFWDLYNEPGNRMIFGPDGAEIYHPDTTAQSRRLLEDCVAWCRDEGPEHPVTVGAWSTTPAGSTAPPYDTLIDRTALGLSDIVTFHAYLDTPHVGDIIDQLAALNRPLYCTEWMARPIGSRISDQLSLFRARGVGCFQWGLVQGRTQTWLPWPDELVAAHGGDADRSIWFHDLLDRDGNPFDRSELRVLQECLSDT